MTIVSAITHTLDGPEYCEACKQTVNLFSSLSEAYSQKRQKNRMGHNTGEDAKTVIDSVCVDERFNIYQPQIKKFCVKILNDHLTEFQKFYTQSVLNPRKNIQKGELFTFIKKVTLEFYFSARCNYDNFLSWFKFCVDEANVCPAEVFAKANISTSARLDASKKYFWVLVIICYESRSQCNACKLISSDIEISIAILNKNTKLRDFLEDGYCNNLGFSYQPYNWLESTCDEMVEDKLGLIYGIFSWLMLLEWFFMLVTLMLVRACVWWNYCLVNWCPKLFNIYNGY